MVGGNFMKISEAVRKLMDIHEAEGDIEIILSSDEEGNHHRDLYGVQVDWVLEEDDEMYPVADEDVNTEYPEEDLTRRVVLW